MEPNKLLFSFRIYEIPNCKFRLELKIQNIYTCTHTHIYTSTLSELEFNAVARQLELWDDMSSMLKACQLQ